MNARTDATERWARRLPFAPGLAFSSCVLAAVACVDTHLDVSDDPVRCARTAPTTETAESILWVSVDLGDLGTRYCSGVLVAPRLLLTSFDCVTYPTGTDATTLAGTDHLFPRPSSDYLDTAEYACDELDGWAPLEDGSLNVRYGGVSNLDALAVGLVGSNTAVTRVDALALAAPDSRCSEGLAILLLRDAPGTPSAPVRLAGIDSAGDDVVMVSARASRGGFVRELLEMRVETVTDQAGTGDTPARSLRLSPSACPYDPGGAIVSAASGALVAIVTESDSGSCDDTTGETLAVRLSSFRAALLDVATTYSQPLAAERRPDAPTLLPDCR
ncbi:MAG TPA: hypothetical protein VMG12_36895 [Polyangiaceae bacterium]|nr:hypothetical protein [Polyangiaceae bacterium]